jgi:PST family polysaccharide transporter
MSILNARLLGPEGVGVFALLVLLKTLSARLTDFGFGRALRFYSANGQIHYLDLKSIVFRLGIAVSTVVILISMLLKILPLNIWNDIDWMVYLLFLPAQFFSIPIMYLRHLLHGQLLISSINISEILERLFYILSFVLFVWYLDFGLRGVSLALSLSMFFLLMQLVLKAQKYKTQPPADSKNPAKLMILKKLWSYGQWSYYSAFIEFIFQNFPLLFLKSSVASFTQIGYFSKAQGLANYPHIAAVPLSGLLFSYNAASTEEKAVHRTEMICRFSFWIITILFVILTIFIKPLIRILYGEAFLPAAEIFYFLYPSVVFYIQALYLSSNIAARGLNKETFTIRLKSLPVIVILSWLLISWLDINGAAIAISFSFTILWWQYASKFKAISNSRFSRLILLTKTDFILIRESLNLIIKKYIK